MKVFQVISFLIIVALTNLSCTHTPPVILADNQAIVVESDSITFAVIGDYGIAGTGEESVADLVKSWEPDFILTTGDNNYSYGEYESLDENITQYYGDFIFNFNAPHQYRANGRAFKDSLNRFFPTPGNHDYNQYDGIAPYLDFFTLPGLELYYTFSWGDIAFYSINSNKSSEIESQKLWLENEIAGSDKCFKVVYFHHPPFSPGPHGSQSMMQWDFHALGIDVVLSGHDHIYARISRKEEPGLHYIVNGLGGYSLYGIDPDKLDDGTTLHSGFNDDFGAMRCFSTNDSLVMEFYSVSNSDEPIDRLIILKRLEP